jgi:glycosyltransferase involved in cell wall biosynthesis
MNSKAKRRLDQFGRFFGQRMRVIRSLPLDRRPVVFRDHDITMWPAHYDSVGTTPLTSMSMGTPVVSFKFPPASEYMTKENSVPVACGGHYNRIGVPLVDPDYQRFERCLQNAVINRDYLMSLQQSVLHGLEKRRKVFNDVMARVIC